MIEDAELLRRYAEEKSEAAFAELVQRHLGLVYACALRRVGGDAQLAEDVTQQVFSDVARRASMLARRPVLAGWLFTSARFAAAKAMRAARRRLDREQEAHLMQELTQEAASQFDWETARPLLDDAIGELGENDREAILLRFFEGRDFSTIGARLRLSDNAARMRVERALDKLRSLLEQRGITSTVAVLATILPHQALVAIPAGLAASVTGAALAGGALATGAAVTGGTSAAITLMGLTKLQIGITGAMALAGATGFIVQAQNNAGLRQEMASLRWQNQALASQPSEKIRLENASAEVAALRADDVALARLRDEAESLHQRLQQFAQAQAANKEERPNAPRAPHAPLAPSTTQVMDSLRPLLDAKKFAEALPLIDNLISTVPPTSYDMSVVLDMKAKLHSTLQQYDKAIEPWEKALQLSEKYHYFTDQQEFTIRDYLAKLRFQQGLTTKPPSTPWF